MTQDTLPRRSWLNFRIQDILLLVMFSALIVLAHDSREREYLAGIAFLQLIEGRVPWLDRLSGRVTSIGLQLLLCYLLLGWSSTVGSEYFPILLLPVASVASYMGLTGTIVTSCVAIGAYLSFLSPIYIDWSQTRLEVDAIHTLEVRCIALAMVAVLVNFLGEARRAESARYKKAAEDLAVANQNLRDAEAAVRRSERLAALGQLSAGLAHELRNPLGSIRGSAELLERSVKSESPVVKELAGIISEEVDRTNSLVTRFLDFARPLEPRREKTDITQVIDKAARHAHVEIIRNYSPEVPELSIDPALMEQVFINLLSNAAQASTPDAPITVATRTQNGDAEVSVVDRGCGIPPDKMETIFNPFVTTKQSGVGLGLAIVAKIVDGHGGTMTVESEPGKGSVFHVRLPIIQ
jgi:two-component system sensor histidine kinase HydH